MKLKNISRRSQFMGTHKPQPDKNARIALENQRKAQADRDGTLKKYIKTNILPIENTTPPIGFVSKTPYSDITTYREEWHINPIDN